MNEFRQYRPNPSRQDFQSPDVETEPHYSPPESKKNTITSPQYYTISANIPPISEYPGKYTELLWQTGNGTASQFTGDTANKPLVNPLIFKLVESDEESDEWEVWEEDMQ